MAACTRAYQNVRLVHLSLFVFFIPPRTVLYIPPVSAVRYPLPEKFDCVSTAAIICIILYGRVSMRYTLYLLYIDVRRYTIFGFTTYCIYNWAMMAAQESFHNNDITEAFNLTTPPYICSITIFQCEAHQNVKRALSR